MVSRGIEISISGGVVAIVRGRSLGWFFFSFVLSCVICF